MQWLLFQGIFIFFSQLNFYPIIKPKKENIYLLYLTNKMQMRAINKIEWVSKNSLRLMRKNFWKHTFFHSLSNFYAL
jgi:transposase-like protein